MKFALTVSVVAVIVLAIVICLIPIRDEAYAVTVNYTEPATKYVTLSYRVNDYITTEIVEEYRRTGSCGCNRELVDVLYHVFCVDVTNTDDVSGQFLIILTGIADGQSFAQNVTLNLSASEQQTAKYKAEVIDCCDFEVIPGWKEIETGELVTKQREEIKYKKVTTLDYLLHYK